MIECWRSHEHSLSPGDMPDPAAVNAVGQYSLKSFISKRSLFNER